MSRRRRASDRHRPHGRGSTRHGARHSSAPPDPTAQNPLIPALRSALRDDDPTAIWVASAPIIALLSEPRELTRDLPEGVDLLQTFLDTNIAETTALLHMTTAMSGDEGLRERARAALTSRRQPMPAQVQGLSQAAVARTTVFGDTAGDNFMVEIALPRGVRAVLVMYVERRPLPYVKDAFVVGEPLGQVQAHYRRIMAAEGFSLDEAMETLEPAQARACLAQALGAAPPDRDPVPGGDGEQWPTLRPFVEFVLGLMPSGGPGYGPDGLIIGSAPGGLLGDPESADADGDGIETPPETPPWITADGTDLAEEFLASEQAAELPADEAVAQLVMYLFLIASAGTGDPLTWSPESAGWVAGELMPTDPVLSETAIGHVPATLPALITWAHARTGTSPRQTRAVHEVIEPLLADLLARRADPFSRARRLEANVDLALETEDPGELRRADLAMRVGGYEELEALHSHPLPAKPLAFDAVPEDLRERVAEIDAHLVEGVDRVNASVLDLGSPVLGAEFLTACRRFLVQIARRDASVLRRRASTRTTAAAIAWTIGRGNDLVGHRPAPVRTGTLLSAFDVRSAPSQRADSLMRAAALPRSVVGVALADAELLVSSTREEILRIRDVLDAT